MRFDPQSNFIDGSRQAAAPLPHSSRETIADGSPRVSMPAVAAAFALAAGIGGWMTLRAFSPVQAAGMKPLADAPAPAHAEPVAEVAIEARAIIDAAHQSIKEEAQEQSPPVEEPIEPWRAAYEAGRRHMAMGRNAEAAAQFAIAVELNPDFADAHYQLGMAYVLLRRPEAARQELAALEPLDPNRASLLRTLVQ